MTTPVVQALAALAAVAGVPFGVGAGIGLGLARALDPWKGALTRTHSSPPIVVERYLDRKIASAFRFGGIAAAVTLLYVDVAWVVR